MRSWQYYTRVAATLALALLVDAASAADCCGTCLTQVTGVVDYDPLVFDQCQFKPGRESRICCFKCGTTGEPQYDTSTVAYDTDGTTPTTKAGEWVKFTWANIQNVSYLNLAENQKKTATPTLKDSMAQQTSGYYMICAKAKGSLVFRGFGSDPCTTVSLEKTIKVLDGDGSTCDAKAPDAPIPEVDDGGVAGCNLNRASVKTVDGKKVCECVSDWAGPPACDQMPTWKWVITIGGGIAALFSIVISVRAFLKSREKKMHDQDERDESVNKADVETLHIGAVRNRSVGSSNTPQQTKYTNYDHHDDEYSVQKVNNREFSL